MYIHIRIHIFYIVTRNEKKSYKGSQKLQKKTQGVICVVYIYMYIHIQIYIYVYIFRYTMNMQSPKKKKLCDRSPFVLCVI